ncbi:cuscuta receptor 1-like isoform X2 [Phaseolus vulgaris]
MLSMRENIFKGAIIAQDFRNLRNLERLILDRSSNLENEFFQSIGDLSSLKILSLSQCDINGKLPEADWFKLEKLEELNLIYNKFEGSLPSSFVNMTSLRILELSYNHFIGNFASNLASLTSLEYFGFNESQFEVPISFTPFSNHSNLKFIYGEGNKVIMDSAQSQTWIPKFQLQVLSLSSTTDTNFIPFPKFLLYQYNITSLDFTSCKLEGEFPNWLLENNTQLTEIIMRNCSFNGNFQLPSHPLLKIRRIDVSDNMITGQIFGSNISSIFPNLQFLNMSMNGIRGSIPREFSQMHLLDTLDLSDNSLSGEIPKNISGDKSELKFLKLSNNKLHGPVFPTLSTLKNLEELYLDGNSLSGSINSFSSTSLLALDISNNHLVGKLPSVIGNLSNLVVLLLSNNHLGGSISTTFVELKALAYLDISRNDFTGLLPSFASVMRFIHMSNNRFTGLSKSTFNSSSPVLLDLSYNRITSKIQDMILDLQNSPLNILILKGNHFSGHIPQQLCQLKELFILDLSSNNISGLIPKCLGKMPFKYENTVGLSLHGRAFGYSRRWGNSFPTAKEKVNFTTKKTSYTYKGDILGYMSGIDLSNNKLNGNIPSEVGNLTGIRALNLSYNDFIGQIPSSFSNLVQTESLDLSFNKLSGQIPLQLNRLSFLAVFSVAHNNLSGETPERKGQFLTFDESSYEDNPFLCGPPLPKSCNPYVQPHDNSPNNSYTDEDNCSFVDMFVFWTSFGVSCTSVLLVIAATLYINPYWRRRWFYNIEWVCTNCYYFIEDNILLKFSNYRST